MILDKKNDQHGDNHQHPPHMEKVVATIYTFGLDPSALTLSPDGKSLYATGHANFWVIDTERREVIHKFAPAQRIYRGLVMAPDGARVYVIRDDQVDVIDTANHTLTTSFGDLPQARHLAISPNGKSLFASFGTTPNSEKYRQVAAIDLQSGQRLWTVDVHYASDIALSPDGTRAFVTQANSGSHEGIVVLDTATGQTIRVGSDLGSTYGIALSTDGAYACVTQSAEQMYVIDMRQDAVKSVTTDSRAFGVAVRPGTHIAYVTQFKHGGNRGNSVGVVDMASGTVLRAISDENLFLPRGIVIAPDGTRAYVASFGGNCIIEIAL